MGNKKWTFAGTISGGDVNVGDILYYDIKKDDVTFTSLCVVESKYDGGNYDVKMLALAFNTREDYKKIVTKEADLDDSKPYVHIAEEEMVYFLSTEPMREFSVKNGKMAIPIAIENGTPKTMITDCLATHSPGMANNSYKIATEPLDYNDKRHAMLASHVVPGLVMTGKKASLITD